MLIVIIILAILLIGAMSNIAEMQDEISDLKCEIDDIKERLGMK